MQQLSPRGCWKCWSNQIGSTILNHSFKIQYGNRLCVIALSGVLAQEKKFILQTMSEQIFWVMNILWKPGNILIIVVFLHSASYRSIINASQNSALEHSCTVQIPLNTALMTRCVFSICMLGPLVCTAYLMLLKVFPPIVCTLFRGIWTKISKGHFWSGVNKVNVFRKETGVGGL